MSHGNFFFQWGTGGSPVNGTTYTFPTPFPNNCFNVQVTAYHNAASNDDTLIVTGSISKTGFIANSGSNYQGIYWFAIGD